MGPVRNAHDCRVIDYMPTGGLSGWWPLWGSSETPSVEGKVASHSRPEPHAPHCPPYSCRTRYATHGAMHARRLRRHPPATCDSAGRAIAAGGGLTCAYIHSPSMMPTHANCPRMIPPHHKSYTPTVRICLIPKNPPKKTGGTHALVVAVSPRSCAPSIYFLTLTQDHLGI